MASGGGHLDLLRGAGTALADIERVWVTTPGAAAEALVEAGEQVRTVPRFDRRNLGPTHILESVSLARRERPRIVVTSGAGVALTFTATARALGARVLFVETMARVSNTSMSGRVLSRVATKTLVQWPEAVRSHHGAMVCRPALLEGIQAAGRPSGEGTFVALGTHDQPFDRLVEFVRAAAARGILPSPIRVQSGVTACPSSPEISASDWMSPQEMTHCLLASKVVVCHAGSGIVAGALRSGHRPLVVPRLGEHGEHVDDHQAQLAAKLARLDLAVHVQSNISNADVEHALKPLRPPAWPPSMPALYPTMRQFVDQTARA